MPNHCAALCRVHSLAMALCAFVWQTDLDVESFKIVIVCDPSLDQLPDYSDDPYCQGPWS